LSQTVLASNWTQASLWPKGTGVLAWQRPSVTSWSPIRNTTSFLDLLIWLVLVQLITTKLAVCPVCFTARHGATVTESCPQHDIICTIRLGKKQSLLFMNCWLAEIVRKELRSIGTSFLNLTLPEPSPETHVPEGQAKDPAKPLALPYGLNFWGSIQVQSLWFDHM
jgi:hypothetical protein